VLGEKLQPEDLGEIAALVFDLSRHDFDWTFDFEGTVFHQSFLDPSRNPAATD